MAQTAPNPYLQTKVMTASPEQLRLMLYDGAVRFCRQARHALGKSDFEGSYTAIVRAQKIMLELSGSLNHDHDADLCDKLAAIYDYVYRLLVDANMKREPEPLDEAIRLVEFQRETWAMLMKKLEHEPESAAAPRSTEPLASIGPSDEAAEPSAGRFSIDA